MLIIINHGGGAKNEEKTTLVNKSICQYDGDCLYTGEISDKLTDNESVDILVFDACLMRILEVAYQYRPNNGNFEIKALIASAPIVFGYGLLYDKIFFRLKVNEGTSREIDFTLYGKEKIFDPSLVTNDEL